MLKVYLATVNISHIQTSYLKMLELFSNYLHINNT